MKDKELEQKRLAMAKHGKKWRFEHEEIQSVSTAMTLLRALFSKEDEWTSNDEIISRVINSLERSLDRKLAHIGKLAKRKREAETAYFSDKRVQKAIRERSTESEPTTTTT